MPITTDVQLPAFHPFLQMDIPTLLRRAVAEHSERQFMVWEPFDGEPRRWTYAQAHVDIRRIAQGLEDRGVKAGDAVVLHLNNSPESILVWFACAELGAVAVTTNTRSAGEEFAYFAERSSAVAAITQPEFADMVRENLAESAWMAVVTPADNSLMADSELEPRTHGPAHPLSIQFTSGTTARPKAVLWTHANGLWGAMNNARHLQIRTEDITLVANPLFHTIALAWQTLGSLWVGASMVVQPKFSASRFWDVVVRNRCSWVTLGFFMAKALADKPVPEDHSVRFNMMGMSFYDNPLFFGLKCMGSHGMTELITQPVINDPQGTLDEFSAGRPSPEYEVRLIKNDGELAGVGERGELQVKGIRGLSLFAEYFGDPEATAKAFTDDGFFKTGDLIVLREDGAFVFSDRDKDMLKVGGENVAASEIERVVLSVEGVKEAAVVAQPHNMLSEVPFAFVIPLDSAGDDLENRIMAACEAMLADFKRPRGVRLVKDFPRSLGGKVAKAELRDQLKAEMAAAGDGVVA